MFFFHRIFSNFYVWSTFLTSCLHIARFCISLPNIPFSRKSTFTLCNPSTSISVFVSFSPPYLSSSIFSRHILHPYMSIPPFLHHLGYSSHFHYPSNSFIPYFIRLCNTTHPSQCPCFCHIQFILLLFLLPFRRKPWHLKMSKHVLASC